MMEFFFAETVNGSEHRKQLMIVYLVIFVKTLHYMSL